MDWRESAASGIPRGPANEPEALRRDIADELDDHLSSAMQRELRRTDDEAQAEEAVLERFGDPREVARQLWWDAMKEKIMRDRILMVALAFITLAGLLVSLAVLRAVRDGQEVNQAMLARIAELSAQPAATNELTGDWSRAVVRVVSDGDAKPMEGVTVQLKGHIFNATDVGELSAKSDKEGIARIGPIKAGQYEFTAWANGHSAHYTNFAFYPGQTNEFTVVAPEAEVASARVKFEIAWPENLSTSDLVLMVTPSRNATVTLGSWKWQRPTPPQLYINSNGKILNVSGNPYRQLILDSTNEATDWASWPPGLYGVGPSGLFVMEPANQETKDRQLISIQSRVYEHGGVSFTASTGEESRIKFDLTTMEAYPSFPKMTLQEQKDEAIKKFLAKKTNS